MKTFTPVLLIASFIPLYLFGQAQDKPVLSVNRASQPVKIDGVLDESEWQQAEVSTPFLNKWPLDSGHAEAKTEVKMLFNDQFIFVSAINYQTRNDLVIQTLKRDQLEAFWTSDGFSVVLDPINQKTNGFMFGVNPGGAQIEGAVNLMGSWSRINENWDNKWFSAVTIHDDYWIAEIAIPFASIRFNKGLAEWGLNFIRSDMKRNVFSTWSRVPLQFNGMDLGHLGTLRWAQQITPDKSNVTVIPYLSGGQAKNHEEGEAADATIDAGVDMKVALTQSLNMDLTFRPDFSNVDVDKQMTNVTRFSLLFPERRNFFLENADLFSNFGSWLSRPFFSRRIGLHEGTPIPILAGARISGNLTKGLRVGIMDIQTQATEDYSANNYLVASAQHQIRRDQAYDYSERIDKRQKQLKEMCSRILIVPMVPSFSMFRKMET
jgi:hypothetical protein